jgi:hypothetical protein
MMLCGVLLHLRSALRMRGVLQLRGRGVLPCSCGNSVLLLRLRLRGVLRMRGRNVRLRLLRLHRVLQRGVLLLRSRSVLLLLLLLLLCSALRMRGVLRMRGRIMRRRWRRGSGGGKVCVERASARHRATGKVCHKRAVLRHRGGSARRCHKAWWQVVDLINTHVIISERGGGGSRMLHCWDRSSKIGARISMVPAVSHL